MTPCVLAGSCQIFGETSELACENQQQSQLVYVLTYQALCYWTYRPCVSVRGKWKLQSLSSLIQEKLIVNWRLFSFPFTISKDRPHEYGTFPFSFGLWLLCFPVWNISRPLQKLQMHIAYVFYNFSELPCECFLNFFPFHFLVILEWKKIGGKIYLMRRQPFKLKFPPF